MPKRESQCWRSRSRYPSLGKTIPGARRWRRRAPVFVFLGGERITVKLDESTPTLSIEGGVPAGYGLGKAGWVTVPLAKVPLDVLRDWVEESYHRRPEAAGRVTDG